MNKRYYVYVYYNELGVAYYVGKGQRYRWYEPRQIPVPDKERIQRFFFANEQESWDTEIQLISFFGRSCDGGTLLNKAAGGPGPAGVKHSDEVRERMAIARRGTSKPIHFISPEGKLHVVRNISEFAREQQLAPAALIHVAQGRRSNHKGYVVSEKSPHFGNKPPALPKRKGRIYGEEVTFVSPNGNTFTTRNVAAFCRKHGLHNGHMSQVTNGKAAHYKGWKRA